MCILFSLRFWILNVLETSWIIYHISLHSGLQQSSWNLFKIYDLSARILCCKQTVWFLSSIWLGRKRYNHHYKGLKDGADDRDVENDRLTSDSNHWWSLFHWFSPSDFRWWTAVLSPTGWVHGSTSGQPRLSRCFFKGNWKAHCCNVLCQLWKRNTPTSNPEVICFAGIPASTNKLIQSSWFGPLCPLLWDTVMRHMWGCYLKVCSCPLVYWRTAFGCGRRIWLSWPIIAWSFHWLPSVESEWTSRKATLKIQQRQPPQRWEAGSRILATIGFVLSLLATGLLKHVFIPWRIMMIWSCGTWLFSIKRVKFQTSGATADFLRWWYLVLSSQNSYLEAKESDMELSCVSVAGTDCPSLSDQGSSNRSCTSLGLRPNDNPI